MVGQRVLIVDDNLSDTLIMRTIASAQGHLVLTANNGHDGFDLAFEKKPAIMLIDLEMEMLSGYDLIRRLRANSNTKNVKIIVVSGRRERRDIVRALSSGADDYVVKPIHPDILIFKMNRLLDPNLPEQKRETQRKMKGRTLNFTIESVSESGLLVESSTSLPVASRQSLQADLLRDIFPQGVTVEVRECLLIEGKYKIRLEFVELSETEQVRLKQYVSKGDAKPTTKSA